ncbi:MAG: polyphosphate kinase 2 [Hyphomicrobium sp.]|uniref:polyphosphate kinase 2 n=1 Tax=Hyphomicrobium sp. TaxID=82 RepID=UPI001327C5E7|nr:polyphosphate kinase 2 [Hyphomicrobium sp.]KAB2943576.1 MAG: polyphosphate kinase 2 [Hyphomicrobium sp.]MBZ0209698.1 polyphosphate kinase 2 [Hyphomicrobium sp.]
MRHATKNDDAAYEHAFHQAQVELVKFQKHVIKHGQKVLVIFEGRDAAGKDGTIKRIVEHLSPRETRVVALGAPSDRDQRAWYFQRYVEQLPVGGEIVLFNRSWYNRAGVERVMGFCTDAEYEEFMKTVPMFEQLLVHCGFTILKYYLDISHEEQERRLKQRHKDPLRQWKLSPIDAKASRHWKDYSEARNVMLARTHSVFAPWIIVRADEKRSARLNVIRDLLSRCDFHGKDRHGPPADPNAVFLFDAGQLANGMIAK